MRLLVNRLTAYCRLAALAGAAMFACQHHHSASAAGVPPLATDTISLPWGTLEGTLPNGLHYLILPNNYPAGRVEFRLIWKVGSVQQEDNQGGCAHFLEHLAFGGSKNFPDRGAVAYLESLGMKYGIDINAFTGHDRTIYMFATPSDSLRAEGFAKPLSIIRDWMELLTINPARVETEKGIILEELRSTFQEDPFYDLKIGQNRFSSRMPLGTAEEVNRMTADVLNEYYRKWYVPMLGAVAVVGDVDPISVEKEIKRLFSSLKASPDPGYRTYPLSYDPERQIMVLTDTLNTREEIELIFPHPGIVTRTLADARRREVGNIVVNALSRRFSDMGIRGDVSDSWYLGSTNHLVFTARESADVPVDSCVSRIASVVKSALTCGFDSAEIKYHAGRAASRIGRLAGKGGKSSGMWCDDFADYIISGDRYLSDSSQIGRLQEAVNTITADEVRQLLAEWMARSDSAMLVAVRTSPLAGSRTLDAVGGWWQRGMSARGEAYTFVEEEESLEPPVPTPAVLAERHPFSGEQIVGKEYLPSIGLHCYTLANGITLLLKATDDDGSVLFGSLAPGGYSSLTPEQLQILDGTASYIDMWGITKAPENLGDYMYQNGMALSTALENDWHGFLGAFKASNAPEFFNLVYEKITDPQLCSEEFEEERESMLEGVGRESTLAKMLRRAPDRMLAARMDVLMGNTLSHADAGGAASGVDAERKRIGRMSLDSIAAFYHSLFNRPQESVYVVCGNFDVDSVARSFSAVFSRLMPMAGEAPHRKAAFSLPDRNVMERFPNENPSQTVFDYLYFGHYEPSLRNSLVLKLMSHLLRNRVIAELREKQALVYSPWVGISYEGKPRGYYYFDVNSSAENAGMPQVHKAMAEVIERLRATAVNQAELDAVKRSFIITRRETLGPSSPSAWRTTIMSLLKNGESLADFNRYESVIGSITPEDIRDGFRRYINPGRFALLYMSDSDMKLE